MKSSSHSGHSAKVEMWLLVNGSTIEVAQMAPDFLLVDHPIDHPPGEASLVLKIDDNERRWGVKLPEGMSAASNRVVIVGRQ